MNWQCIIWIWSRLLVWLTLGWLVTTPRQEPLCALINSGICFHFPLPSAARALRFRLLLKNPAPTLGLKPPTCKGFVESLLTATKSQGEERPIFKSWQWQEIECADFQTLQRKGQALCSSWKAARKMAFIYQKNDWFSLACKGPTQPHIRLLVSLLLCILHQMSFFVVVVAIIFFKWLYYSY